MTEFTETYFERSAGVLEQLAEDQPPELDELVESVITAWDRGGKVVSCGNGGSATDSQHFTTELVARFKNHSIHKPAISLVSNPATLTAVSNDWNYEQVFSRQLEAYLQPEDVFLAISTSGNSENVLNAMNRACEVGARRFALTGVKGGQLLNKKCTLIAVPSEETAHIQEAHAACLHYVCSRIDDRLNG
jgi:D-sedoheptulose 7-phosphate isomerase